MQTVEKIVIKCSDFQHVGYLEFLNLGDLTLCKSEEYIVAGTVCNIGMLPDYLHPIDPDFSMEENMQAFVENLEYLDQDVTYKHPDLVTDFIYSFQ